MNRTEHLLTILSEECGETIPDVEEGVMTDADRILDHENVIILYNDEVNTFEHVIKCLVKYCKHEFMQAEQVAFLVHTKGKCDVKHGSLIDLSPICAALQENDLDAKIEE